MSKYTEDQLAAARAFAAKPNRDLAASIRSGETECANPEEFAAYHDDLADEIEAGKADGNLTVAQRMIVYLTGECPPILP